MKCSSGLLIPLAEAREVKDSPRQRSGSRVFKTSPSPISLIQAVGGAPMTGSSTPESTTPTGKSTRRSFWDILVSYWLSTSAFCDHLKNNRSFFAQFPVLIDCSSSFDRSDVSSQTRMKVSMFLSLHQSKPDSAELGSPKTTDDIVQEKGEEGRAARRRHKTENVKQQWSQDKTVAVELEQTQRWDSLKPL